MVNKRNFTVSGDYVQVIAHLNRHDEPVFDLTIGTSECEMTHGDLTYKELLEVCNDIRSELLEMTEYWSGTGKELADFNENWRKKHADDQ